MVGQDRTSWLRLPWGGRGERGGDGLTLFARGVVPSGWPDLNLESESSLYRPGQAGHRSRKPSPAQHVRQRGSPQLCFR